jgi:hypothetical protein
MKWYPILQINDLLDQIKGGKLFPNIDFILGYHQVPIEQTNACMTTFNTKENVF